jgi:hypothetical protein
MIDTAHAVKRHWGGILQDRNARGYRSTCNLKVMVYLLAGKLDLLLPV